MDWNRYKELNMLEHFGRFEEALRGLDELESECSDPEDKVLLLLSISNCLGRLKRYPEARQPLEKAFGLVGEHSHLHPESLSNMPTLIFTFGIGRGRLSNSTQS